MSPPVQDERAEASRPPFRRVIVAALLGFAAIAVLVPEARWISLAAAVLFALVLVPRSRNALQARPSAPAQNSPADLDLLPILEAMPEPAFLTDRSLAFHAANEAARRVFGDLGRGTPIAMRFRAPEVLTAADEALATGDAREADFVERLPDDRTWALDILPVRARADRQPALFLFRFRDRTAERRIERMRIDFVANASHELRTPLAALLGFIETLQGPARNDLKAQERFLQIMREQARRMSRLIDDLLSLSRIETKRRLSPEDRADLVEVLRLVHAEMAALAEESGVELILDLDGIERFEITGDRDELVRVFSNLVENACRYAASGRRVVLGLTRDKGGATASVRDFGPGIEEEHIPRLTERFYRVADKAFPAGTGLGLSIVRNILLRHGTRLSVRSTLGEGSIFSARFRSA